MKPVVKAESEWREDSYLDQTMQGSTVEEYGMKAYEIATVVHDARIDVDPSLNGQRVRVIILHADDETPPGNGLQPMALRDRLSALQDRFTSSLYNGSEVVDERRES